MEVGSSFLNIDYILAFGKAAILLILIIYAIFAAVIVRQVDLMSKTLITSISPYIRTLSVAHLLFALGLVILSWRVL